MFGAQDPLTDEVEAILTVVLTGWPASACAWRAQALEKSVIAPPALDQAPSFAEHVVRTAQGISSNGVKRRSQVSVMQGYQCSPPRLQVRCSGCPKQRSPSPKPCSDSSETLFTFLRNRVHFDPKNEPPLSVGFDRRFLMV